MFFLSINQFAQNNFVYPIPNDVHSGDPFQLILGFQSFRNALLLGQLRNESQFHFPRLAVNPSRWRIRNPFTLFFPPKSISVGYFPKSDQSRCGATCWTFKVCLFPKVKDKLPPLFRRLLFADRFLRKHQKGFFRKRGILRPAATN